MKPVFWACLRMCAAAAGSIQALGAFCCPSESAYFFSNRVRSLPKRPKVHILILRAETKYFHYQLFYRY